MPRLWQGDLLFTAFVLTYYRRRLLICALPHYLWESSQGRTSLPINQLPRPLSTEQAVVVSVCAVQIKIFSELPRTLRHLMFVSLSLFFSLCHKLVVGTD